MQPSQIHPKIAAVGITGTICTILVWTLDQFGITMPADVAVAFATLIVVLVGYAKAS